MCTYAHYNKSTYRYREFVKFHRYKTWSSRIKTRSRCQLKRYRAESPSWSHNPANFSVHKSSDSGDIHFFKLSRDFMLVAWSNCRVTSQNHLIEETCESLDRSSSWHCDSGDMFLTSHVTLRYYTFNGSCSFMGGWPSRCFTEI